MAFLDRSDFESLRYSMRIINETSSTEVASESEIQLLEFTTETVKLELPQRRCASGHQLQIVIVPDYEKGLLALPLEEHRKRGTVMMTGKVIETEPHSPSTVAVQVKLVQYLEDEWESILKAYGERQEMIDTAIVNYNR